jgi:hypothetical protein
VAKRTPVRAVIDRPGMGRFPPTVAERLFARALALAATSEGPTDEGVRSLVDLAGDNPKAIEQALARVERLGGLGRSGDVACQLLRSAIEMTGAREETG